MSFGFIVEIKSQPFYGLRGRLVYFDENDALVDISEATGLVNIYETSLLWVKSFDIKIRF